MSPLRNTVRPRVAALAAVVVAVSLAACGREEEDLSNGKAQFVQKCGSCHVLNRAGTQGQTGPSLDAAFREALQDGMGRETVQGVVHSQIANVRKNSKMPANLVTGDDARDVAAYVAYATGKPGEDEGALAQAGLAGATTGEQIFTGAGCGGCHQLATVGATGNIGPSLEELAAAAGEREPGKSAEEYLREAIVEPDAYVVSGFNAGVMPSFEGKLTDEQLQALIEYLLGN
ncbi:MAG TPA: c-type cytochrome [Thermoleophilaceae bacterium]|nr:c-type cytochrome [Thermoleophilaceae bacterium]